jgi:uncharacterized repeat protein (TIGR03803 family)
MNRTCPQFSRSFMTVPATCFLLLTIAWASGPERAIHRFQGGNDGLEPAAALVAGTSDNWYGTTEYGGGMGRGTVFELSPTNGGASYTESVLYAFQGGTDGAEPQGRMVFDSSGNLYGTTAVGGANNDGTIFQLSPAQGGTWTETVIYSFSSFNDGWFPVDLTIDKQGNLYGEDPGYPESNGSVFELSPPAGQGGAWTYKTLYNFRGLPKHDGSIPLGGLVMNSQGDLYGTTWIGGLGPGCNSYGCGIVFKMKHPQNQGGSWKEKILYRFQGTSDGAEPYGGVAIAKGGNLLFGTTGYGGNEIGDGTVFQLAKSGNTWTETVLHSFDRSSDGFRPMQRVVIDRSGNLYSTMYFSQSEVGGEIFELSPGQGGAWTERVLYDFAGGWDGSYNPSAPVLSGSDSALFGTTPGGGAHGYGEVFKLFLK